MKYLIIYCIYIFFISCKNSNNIYSVKGSIQSIEHGVNKITIAHDTIPELMPPMIMPFSVRERNELLNLHVGDSVHFQLIWDEIQPYATHFEVISKGRILENDDFFSNEHSEKNFGEIIDDVTLLDMDNKEVKLSYSDGKYRFISFIFSRCPMPNMCPAVMMKNRILAASFSEIEFIAVSFDYKYDSPAVLKQTYGPAIESYDNWKIWSSLGRIDDIYRLIRQSGGNFWGVENNKIGHTLSSVLIGPNREVLGVWKGEEWDVNQAKNAIQLYIE
tara:strand:- start:193 stop:1014 length:822 start_codon:yes stop_codon:yes gene_type:complete